MSDGGRDLREGSGLGVEVGSRHVVDIIDVAHGGHMVARLGALVVFVRHALPGERVEIRITQMRSKFARADVVEVLASHPARRTPPCSVAGACGGCDFQHAHEPLQRALKTQVLRESLIRHGGLEPDRVAILLQDGVLALGEGFGWRSRMHYRVLAESGGTRAPGGRLALHRHRSDQLVPADGCVIAEPSGHQAARRVAVDRFPGEEIWMATSEGGPVVATEPTDRSITQSIDVDGTRIDFEVPLDGFWQVHPALAQALVDTLLAWTDPPPGARWWDLYAGVGPLAAAIGSRVGESGRVEAVESSAVAVARGREALAHMPWIRFHRSDVRRWLAALRAQGSPHCEGSNPDGVIVDPPRSGAGEATIAGIASFRPRRIVMVACDPVALGRDCALLSGAGYRLARVRAWDAFPQTHHLETIALFERDDRIS